MHRHRIEGRMGGYSIIFTGLLAMTSHATCRAQGLRRSIPSASGGSGLTFAAKKDVTREDASDLRQEKMGPSFRWDDRGGWEDRNDEARLLRRVLRQAQDDAPRNDGVCDVSSVVETRDVHPRGELIHPWPRIMVRGDN